VQTCIPLEAAAAKAAKAAKAAEAAAAATEAPATRTVEAAETPEAPETVKAAETTGTADSPKLSENRICRPFVIRRSHCAGFELVKAQLLELLLKVAHPYPSLAVSCNVDVCDTEPQRKGLYLVPKTYF
jgi:hypothetical protein